MERKNFCPACTFAANGVKTRKSIPHTCGTGQVIKSPKFEYIPTREELDKYLNRLEELMPEDEQFGNPE
jgi:hypothetical protein